MLGSKLYSTFDPRALGDCALWLDAADRTTLTLSGSNVTRWSDKSGYNRHADASSNAPAVDSNGGLYFSNSFYGTSLTGDPTNETAFVVFNTSNSGILLGGYSSGRQIGLQNSNTIGPLKAMVAWGPQATFTTGVRQLVTTQTSSSASSSLTNGGSNSATGSGFTFTSSGVTTFGREAGSSFPYTGFIHEVILYSSILTAGQCRQVEGYLAQKWGLRDNIPVVHPYKSSSVFLRAFNPTDIDGCSLWLDAADNATLTLSGSNITAWADKSGNVYDASQSTASNQPLVGTSNTITFQSNRYFNLPQASINNASNYSIILAVNLVSASNYIFVKQHNGVNTYNVLTTTFSTPGANFGTSNYLYWRTSNAGTQANSGQSVGTGLQLLEILYDGSNVTMYKNGTLLSTTAAGSGTANIANATGATNFTLGVWDAGGIIYGNVTDFRLGELLFYNTVLTSAQRQQVETYLATKWGLRGSTPSGHPTRFSPALSVQFSPFQLSNCVFWLDAAKETGSNGAFVNTVSDYSPSKYSITAVTNNTVTVVRPGLNGLPHYSMGSNRFTVSSFTGTAAFTSAFVVQSSNSGFFFSHFTSGGSYTCYTLYQNFDLAFIRGAQWYDASLGRGGLIATNVWSIVITQYGLTGTVPPWRFNGSQRTSASGGGSALPTSNDSVTGPLFINGNNGSAWDSSRVAEILHFNAALSVPQCQQVEGYLAWKWGLQSNLPSGHPYRNNPPL